MDPSSLEAAFERFPGQIAGVLACATFGTAPPASSGAWRELCEAHGVPLLIDSAPGFGTPRRRRSAYRRRGRHRDLFLPRH